MRRNTSGVGEPGRRQRLPQTQTLVWAWDLILSKGEFKRAFKNLGEDRETKLMRIPSSTLAWLKDPGTLGRVILKEIKGKHSSLTVRRAWEDM